MPKPNPTDRETSFAYLVGDEFASFYTDENKWKNKVAKWEKEFPNKVSHKVTSNEGWIVRLPVTWFKVAPRRKKQVSK